MKKKNVIWIIVDGVRNYTAKDKYGKLEVMEKFSEESVEFTNAVTSAASTLMSISAMFSSRPAYYISRDFESFEYDKKSFPTFTDILKSHGYENYVIHHYYYMRKKMTQALGLIPKKYWPKWINKHQEWDEKTMNTIFNRVINNNLKKPFFLFMHYNVPITNKSTSKTVGNVLRKLKEKKLYDDSIIILSSDHGFPDPARYKLTLEQKVMEGHDIFITDDNILFPLIIKYPGCPKNHKVKEVVSSLDIAPTILSMLNIPYKGRGFEGTDLMKYVGNKKKFDRKIRTDTRFYFQPKKITTIKGNKYKYTISSYNQPEQKEGFFDIEKDHLERTNLIDSKDKKIIKKITEYREEFIVSEEKGIKLQKKYLKQKFDKIVHDKNLKETKKVLLFGTSNMLFVDIIIDNILKSFKNVTVDLIIRKNSQNRLITKSDRINYINSNLTYKDFNKRLGFIRRKRYDLMIIPLSNQLGVGFGQIFKIARRIRANNKIRVNYNMVLVKETNILIAVIKYLREDIILNLIGWKNFAGNLVALARRILFDKPY